MTLRRSDDPLDTYLLRIFVLLITERSVSRTALRMNQSQPAVSAALKRLREILGDPLLVREKGGMVPTERALALMSHAKGALAEIDRMTDAPESFEPHSTRQEFRIGSPDYLAPVFVAGVAERFRREAPQARLMTDLGDFAAVNAVMADYFSAPYPARSTIEVAGLPRGAQVEVDAILAFD